MGWLNGLASLSKGSNPTTENYFNCVIFACLAFPAAQLSPYKFNQALYLSEVIGT